MRIPRFRYLLVAFFLVATCPSLFAQSDGYLTGSNLRGVYPANTYQFGDIDSINLGTGGININVPLFTRKGRGLSLSGRYIYSSKLWTIIPDWDPANPSQLDALYWEPTTTQNGFFGTSPGGGIGYQEQEFDCVVAGQPLSDFVDFAFTYVGNDGTTYQFPNRHRWNTRNNLSLSCPGEKLTINDVASSSDGTLQLDTSQWPTNALVTFKDGTRISNSPRFVEDTNGNLINSQGDTLLRQIGGTTTQFILKDSNGSNQTYTLTGSYVNVSTAFPTTTSCVGAPFVQYTNWVWEVSSVALPNGWTYGFAYDSQFGDITKVTLPSGGYVRYDYTVLATVDAGPPNTCSVDSRRIAHRYVSPDGNSAHEQTWTYAYSNYGLTTTVTDPIGNSTVHNFTNLGNIPHETSTLYYQAGTLLKTVANTWASEMIPVASQGNSVAPVSDYGNWRITDTLTTLNDTNQVTDVQTDYDSWAEYTSAWCGPCNTSRLNPVEVREYDYGSGSRGALLRRTDTAYLHDSNSNYLNAHIWDRATSKSVYDGNGNLKAQTTFEYDNFTQGITSSGAVQHDSAYNTGYTLRGNLTASSRWRNTDGASLTTRNQYDDAGNVRITTDPNNNSTTFSYADSWGNSACSPSGGTAAAFVTSVTNALSQASHSTYNSCAGTVASATDANNQTTSFSFDNMDRETQINFPDGGQTSYSYTDASLPLRIASTKKITASQNLVATALFDGLGRIYQSQLNSDPEGVDYVDTSYDSLGRVSSVSNPHRSTSSSTDGTTSTAYDALGRVTTTTLQDGSVSTASYSGNCTTATDPASKTRKSCSDGIGRLVQVFEDPAGLDYETDYTYDALDNLTQVQQRGGTTDSSQWRTRSFVYDSLSHLTSATNPESGTATYTYDSDGNVLTKTGPHPNQTNPAVSLTSHFQYDALNRLTLKWFDDQTQANAYFAYDGGGGWGVTQPNTIGRLQEVWTGSACCATTGTIFGYDAMGRVTVNSQRLISDGTGSQSISYNYDLAGDLTSYTTGVSVLFSQSFDAAMRPTALTTNYVNAQHPGSLATVGQYWPTGAIQAVSFADGLTEATLYNPRLQPCRINSNTSGSYFTAWGQCSGSMPSGNVIDLENNWNGGSTDNGNLVATANTVPLPLGSGMFTQSGLTAFQPASIADGDATTNGWHTDSASAGAWLQIDLGSGNQRAIVQANIYAAYGGYAGNYNVQYSDNASSWSTAYSGFVPSLGGWNQESWISVGSHRYWRLYLTNTPGPGPWLNELQFLALDTRSFTYDGLNRLQAMTAVGMPCQGLGWTYDPWGNRTQQNLTSGSCVAPQTPVISNNQLAGYTYDAAGNLINDGSHTYTYDAEGHVVSVDGGSTASYIYDGNGRRVRKTVGSTWTDYVYDLSGNVVTEYQNTCASQCWSRSYIYLAGQLVSEFQNGTTNFVHRDHLGSARVVTTLTSGVYDELDYLPFGEQISGQTGTPHKFTGKERDAESNLDYFGARYLTTSLGRFMSPDWSARPVPVPYAVVGDPQSLNLYSYVRNNPLSQADADGHCGGSDVPCPIQNISGNSDKQQVVTGTGEIGLAVGIVVGIMQPEVAVGEIAAGALTSSGLIVKGSADVLSGATHSGSTEELKNGIDVAQNPIKLGIAAVNGNNLDQANKIGDVIQGAAGAKTLLKDPHGATVSVVSAAKDVYDGVKAAFSLAFSARATYRNATAPPPPPSPPKPPAQVIQTQPQTKVRCDRCG